MSPSSRDHSPALGTSKSFSDRSASEYLSYPVSHVVSGLYRRLTDTAPPSKSYSVASSTGQMNLTDVYNPPGRTASPFQPPALTPLTLKGQRSSTTLAAQILSRALAEEIRLLVPPRLQLRSEWMLVYSIEQDGTSLSTLYTKCREASEKKNGFVLVIRDSLGGIFGAFLTDAPHPAPYYFGTGECFLWRATMLPISSLLANLPPPPSTDTTNLQARSTTIASPPSSTTSFPRSSFSSSLHHNSRSHLNGMNSTFSPPPSFSTPNGHTHYSYSQSQTQSNPNIDLLDSESPTLPSFPSLTSPLSPQISLTPQTSRSHQYQLPPQPPVQQSFSTTPQSQYQTQPQPPPFAAQYDHRPSPAPSFTSGTSTPELERLRFKAFPYSGVNDYIMFCETGFLSLGGGDGKYGLWLDGVLEKGVSSACMTFGNEPLSEEGSKFDVLGVEVWSLG
ncbi:oxidation resistance protein 1 [Agyrium rufum]|nr:oxidation resistance protein 1 [Agyrium rufum]